jgi:phosphatidylglycerol:prolipoprotein diacylglycerol transferase
MTHVVTFPGLGLSFTLNRVAFHLLTRPVYWYGIIITCGLLLAVFLCCRWAPRYGINTDQIVDMMIFAVPAALIALRVYYVVFNLDLYRAADGSLEWSRIFRYSDGGLAIYGAIISSIIVLLIFCKVRKISFLAFADLGVHGLLIGQVIGRWGNFVNVEAYGGATTLPWRMCAESIANDLYAQGLVDGTGYAAVLDGTLGVHPTFLYESLWNLVGLALVYVIGRKFRKYDGECFLFYLFWYGLGRAWIEGLRTDSLYFFGLTFLGVPIRTSQMVALVSMVAAGALLIYLRWFRAHDPADLYVNKLAAAAEAASAETGSAEAAARTGTQPPESAGSAAQAPGQPSPEDKTEEN